MECRRITTAVVAMGPSEWDTAPKRTPYFTLYSCHLSRPESSLSQVFRYGKNGRTWYGVICNGESVVWYQVSGSSCFVSEQALVVTAAHTNILEALEARQGPRATAASSRGTSSVLVLDTTENPKKAKPFAWGKEKITVEKKEKENEAEPEPTPASLPLPPAPAVSISREHIYVETVSGLAVYAVSNGDFEHMIDMGGSALSSLRVSLCGKYLILSFTSGVISTWRVGDWGQVYRHSVLPTRNRNSGEHRSPSFTISSCDGVFGSGVFLGINEETVILGRTKDGAVLLELSYPEPLVCAVQDVLQRRILAGGVSGTIYHTRIDGEPSEFRDTKIATGPIHQIQVSLCGLHFFAVSEGCVTVVSLRDGKAVQSIRSGGKKYFFILTTSSNFHLE